MCTEATHLPSYSCIPARIIWFSAWQESAKRPLSTPQFTVFTYCMILLLWCAFWNDTFDQFFRWYWCFALLNVSFDFLMWFSICFGNTFHLGAAFYWVPKGLDKRIWLQGILFHLKTVFPHSLLYILPTSPLPTSFLPFFPSPSPTTSTLYAPQLFMHFLKHCE